MSKEIGFFISVLCAMIFSSCGDEYKWSEFKKLEIDCYGIELFPSANNEFIMTGEIPAKGMNFSFVPKEKYEDWINDIWIDVEGFFQGGTDLSIESVEPRLKGEWGELCIDLNKPHEISVHINKNSSNVPRIINIEISGAYYRTHIRLTQAAE